MKKTTNQTSYTVQSVWIILFSIAFAMVESAVVIYLRTIYYPDGFSFPLQAMTLELASVELFRELATLIMITAIAVLTGHNPSARFAWFLIVFAIWDIFYYVFLKIFLNWPASWFDFDILFLLPTVWTGPVLAPIILSLLMIVLGSLLLHYNRKWHAPLSRLQWVFLIGAAFLAILSFLLDFVRYQIRLSDGKLRISGFTESKFWLAQYVPESYPWVLFWLSTGIISFVLIHYIKSQRIHHSKLSNYQWF